MLIQKLRSWFITYYSTSNNQRFVNYLRNKGVEVGEGTFFRFPRKTIIDTTRPHLVHIGSNVDIGMGFMLLTHDWGSHVFLVVYNDFINSSGKVSIGDNTVIGRNVTILKGVSVGANCIIGAGSIVTHSIPDNVVAAGNPCRVICTLSDYYEKRKKKSIDEAFELVHEFYKRNNRFPLPIELNEEFVLYIGEENIDLYPGVKQIIRQQLGLKYEIWLQNHSPMFNSYEAFLTEVKNRYNIQEIGEAIR